MIPWKWPSLVVIGLLFVAGTSGALAQVDVRYEPAGTQTPVSEEATADAGGSSVSSTATLIACITVFVLAIFVGFEVITKVPPTLHTPLMSGSNAISGITVVGALILAGAIDDSANAAAGGLQLSKIMALIAVVLATINVVGGFLVTDRMLRMFKRN